MKNYKSGIILGIVSIISTIIFVGIPIGNNFFEIVNEILYVTGLMVLLYLGLIRKNDKFTIIFSIVYLIVLFILTGFIELNYNDFTLVAIGIIPGLLISIVGLIRTISNMAKYKTRVSLIINIIALILSIISFLMIFLNRGINV